MSQEHSSHGAPGAQDPRQALAGGQGQEQPPSASGAGRVLSNMARRVRRRPSRVRPSSGRPTHAGPLVTIHEPAAEPGAVPATVPIHQGSGKPPGPGGPSANVWAMLDISSGGFLWPQYIYLGCRRLRSRLDNISGQVWNTVNRL